jgi:hypothetical protein
VLIFAPSSSRAVSLTTKLLKQWDGTGFRPRGNFILRLRFLKTRTEKSPERDAAKAQACFEHALSVARQQQAKSCELRAAMSMARLWRDQRKRYEGRDLLAPVQCPNSCMISMSCSGEGCAVQHTPGPLFRRTIGEKIGDVFCRLQFDECCITRPLHRTGWRFAQWNRPYLLGWFRKYKLILSGVAIWSDACHWRKVRDGRHWLGLVSRNIFDLRKHSARNSNCVPSVLAQKHFVKSLMLRGHDHGIGFVAGYNRQRRGKDQDALRPLGLFI